MFDAFEADGDDEFSSLLGSDSPAPSNPMGAAPMVDDEDDDLGGGNAIATADQATAGMPSGQLIAVVGFDSEEAAAECIEDHEEEPLQLYDRALKDSNPLTVEFADASMLSPGMCRPSLFFLVPSRAAWLKRLFGFPAPSQSNNGVILRFDLVVWPDGIAQASRTVCRFHSTRQDGLRKFSVVGLPLALSLITHAFSNYLSYSLSSHLLDPGPTCGLLLTCLRSTA